MNPKDVVAVHYKEQCALDDDYGKKCTIDLFATRELAMEHLTKIGFKPDSNGRMVFHQYHSEVHATIHNVRWKDPLTNLFVD